MNRATPDIPFSSAVRAQQERMGSRKSYARMEEKGFRREVTDDLAQFIAQRESFYMGTAGADGQPYIQHRGGEAGFLKVIDEHTLAFADYSGNRQYITIGNLSENGKAFLFLIDYANRRRIKIWGTAEYIEGDAALNATLTDGDEALPVERAIVFHIEVWDINCPKYIPQLFNEQQVSALLDQHARRVMELEAENKILQERIANTLIAS